MSNFSYSIYHVKAFCVFVALSFLSNSVIGQDGATQEITNVPEPLMFDLVRGLGARQGELEVNCLVDIPLNNTTYRGVDWAPEIEYALFDNLAVELEFPVNNSYIEAYKTAIQWTIGTSSNRKFIHGFQAIGEKYIHDDIFEFNFLYVPAYRFSEVWSAIGLFGIMLETGTDAPRKKNSIILNASVFADLNKHTVVGIEINNSDPTFQKVDDNNMELLILPQVHYTLNHGYSFQLGIGPKFYHKYIDASVVLRAIKFF